MRSRQERGQHRVQYCRGGRIFAAADPPARRSGGGARQVVFHPTQQLLKGVPAPWFFPQSHATLCFTPCDSRCPAGLLTTPACTSTLQRT